jgi:hypothetical protein
LVSGSSERGKGGNIEMIAGNSNEEENKGATVLLAGGDAGGQNAEGGDVAVSAFGMHCFASLVLS